MSGKIPENFIQELKRRVSLLELVGEHVVLKKSGSNYSGLCPFHQERTPSFSVSEEKSLYHCYGCKKGGDLIRFAMDLYGLSFTEALESLAERARMPLPAQWQASSHASSERQEKLQLAHKLNRFIAAFYHQNLRTHPPSVSYFNQRGVGESEIRDFYLGSAPAAWDGLVGYLKSKKAPLELARELGVIRPSERNPGDHFDLFRGRVMFPILDSQGRISGFGGRTLGEDTPKYLNSSDSFVFQKGKLLFALYQAQKHIREQDEVVIVEGYFDVLTLQAAGFKNIISTAGTSLTVEHLKILSRLTSRITLLFDGDEAGVSATERAMEQGLALGMVLRGAFLPQNQDPDEMLLQKGSWKPGGREALTALLQQAEPLLDLRLRESAQRALQGPEQKTQMIKKIASWLTQYQDPVGRQVRLEWLKKEGGIDPYLLQQAGLPLPNAGGNIRIKPQQVVKPLPVAGIPPLSTGDRIILRALLRRELFEPILKKAGDHLPPGEALVSLLEEENLHPCLHDPNFKADQLLASENEPSIRAALTEAMIEEPGVDFEGELKISLDRALVRRWAQFSQKVRAALAQAEVQKDADLQAKLMKDYLDVQRKIKEFNNFI